VVVKIFRYNILFFWWGLGANVSLVEYVRVNVAYGVLTVGGF